MWRLKKIKYIFMTLPGIWNNIIITAIITINIKVQTMVYNLHLLCLNCSWSCFAPFTSIHNHQPIKEGETSFVLSNLFLKGSTLRAYVTSCQDPRSVEELLRYPEFINQISSIAARKGVSLQIILDTTVKKFLRHELS